MPNEEGFTARPYQLQLLDYVMERNGIIYLPTGAGKTIIAIMALKRFSHQMSLPITEGGKRAVYMCNTVELARQQYFEIKKNTNLKVGLYIGERDVDSWKITKWAEEILENQVLVGTAQIFIDIVSQNFIKISNLSVVIIDECHHATKTHPMNEFMRMFQYSEQTMLPRVIGLTGVLLKGNKLKDIVKELNNLEAKYRGNIVTVTNMEDFENVMLYSTKPAERMITYQNEKKVNCLENTIKGLVNNCIEVVDLWDIGNEKTKLSKGLHSVRDSGKKHFIKTLLKDFLYQMEDYGVYAASYAIMSPIIEFEIRKRQAETLLLRNLYRYVITLCERIRHILVKHLGSSIDTATTEATPEETYNKILNVSTSKLKTFLKYVVDTFEGKKKEDICCLVFVERRYSAKNLYFILKKFVECSSKLKNVLLPEFMIGRNSISPCISGILERKWNKSAISKFHNKECNIIICSNVLEEGIDLQACNYVLILDELKTFNSYMQTKGRARSANSTYGIFTPKETYGKIIKKLHTYNDIHESIKHFLMTRLVDREDPDDDQIAEQFNAEFSPFITKSGAMLLASSALSLLHRYCQLLPTDAFGVVLPWFQLIKNYKGNRIVSVKLPLQSTVKETILSDSRSTVKLAKIDAALKTCIKLYEHGELNDKLQPISSRECVANVAEELFMHWEKFDDNVVSKKLGKQKRRMYRRLCPIEFYASMPVINETCYAYKIMIQPDFEPNHYNGFMYKAFHEPTCFAILLNKRLPRLAEMPLFMNQGIIRVKIAEEPLEFTLIKKCDLQKLRQFQYMIYNDILHMWKHFLILDNRNKENSYLIVPIKNNTIDWDLVNQFARLPKLTTPSIAERKERVYRPEDYIGKVVNKWYSGLNEYFIVVNVLTHMTPMSPFTDDNYESFSQFVTTKYRSEVKEIYQKDQFLIEVRQLTKRRNFFVNSSHKAGKGQKYRGSIILIPETVHNYKFPGDMWLKALLLPCILHRVCFMLHAELIRKRVNSFLNIEHLRNIDYVPKPLIIDQSLKRTVDVDGNVIRDMEVTPKLLSPLPTVETSVVNNLTSLTKDESHWEQYMEPINLLHLIGDSYQVELDYYCNFISGNILKTNCSDPENDKSYSESQMDMPDMKTDVKNCVIDTRRKALTDVPEESKRIVEILELTNDNSRIKSAEQYEILAALTTANASDVFDMERYELLGDSFLKFSISLYLTNRYPTWHEGFLTVIKSRLVSNRNLLYCMLDMDIPQRIYNSLFQPQTDWLPPNASLPENVLEFLEQNLNDTDTLMPCVLYDLQLNSDEIISSDCSPAKLERFKQGFIESKHNTNFVQADSDSEINNYINRYVMPDKVVADVLEAILGVCVKNYGIYNGFRMLEFFGVLRPNRDAGECLSNLLDFKLGSTLLRANISSQQVDGFLINHEKLESNLGYKFRDRAYLLQALTHPSYPTNRITGCYQELEFIGDAILDFLVSCYIFERNQKMTPGMLTDLRSALVNNVTLACVCVRHRFHLFLLAENAGLTESINSFADFQATQNYRVTDTVRILLEETSSSGQERDNTKFNMAVNVDVPKALGDIVEALIAAVYLDSRDLKTTWHVIYNLLKIELNEFSENVPIDPVRQLYEHKYANPHFSDPLKDNNEVLIKCNFTCLQERIEVNGFGVNAKQAKKAAAKHALQMLVKHHSL